MGNLVKGLLSVIQTHLGEWTHLGAKRVNCDFLVGNLVKGLLSVMQTGRIDPSGCQTGHLRILVGTVVKGLLSIIQTHLGE